MVRTRKFMRQIGLAMARDTIWEILDATAMLSIFMSGWVLVALLAH